MPTRTSTNRALAAIRVGPQGSLSAMAITPGGRTLYVANSGANTVTPIRTAAGRAPPPIRVGGADSGPDGMAITPDGTRAYVINESGIVTPIRVATNTALTPPHVRREQLSECGARCYGIAED